MPFLSVVIPAYNEETRILDTLEQVTGYLGGQDYSWEVVVADDGSSDATAAAVADAYGPAVRLLRLPHRGKGWAVRQGMLAAGGQRRLLCDADLSVPIEFVERLMPPGGPDVDVAVGSREAPGGVRYGEPARRHLMGRIFNGLARRLSGLGLNDTQCGFKLFRAAAAEQLFARQTIDGFAFDVEALFLARRAGYTIAEVGVEWRYGEASKVRPLRDSAQMLADLLRIRWRHLRIRN